MASTSTGPTIFAKLGITPEQYIARHEGVEAIAKKYGIDPIDLCDASAEMDCLWEEITGRKVIS